MVTTRVLHHDVCFHTDRSDWCCNIYHHLRIFIYRLGASQIQTSKMPAPSSLSTRPQHDPNHRRRFLQHHISLTRCRICAADDRDGDDAANWGAVDADSLANCEAGERLSVQCCWTQDTTRQGEGRVSSYAGQRTRTWVQSRTAT